jgi:hypothetical protein
VYPDEQRDEASAIQWPESVPGHEPEYQSLHAHRLLSTPERAVIVWMLDEDEDAAMRQQIGRLRVTHTCLCGCPSVRLHVDGSRPTRVRKRAQSFAYAERPTRLGMLLLLQDNDGRLCELRLWTWVDDSPPSEFGEVSEIELSLADLSAQDESDPAGRSDDH